MNKALILTISACIFTGIASDAGEKALLTKSRSIIKNCKLHEPTWKGRKPAPRVKTTCQTPILR